MPILRSRPDRAHKPVPSSRVDRQVKPMNETEKWTLARIAKAVGGRVSGDPGKVICGTASFEDAGSDHMALAGTPRFLKRIDRTGAGAVMVPADFQCPGKSMVQAENPEAAFARVMGLFHRPVRPEAGISPSAIIGEDFACGSPAAIAAAAVIGKRVTAGDRLTIHPGAVIGDDVVMGDDVEIFPNVTVLERTRIGNRVTIQAGSVIGSTGFGYAPDGRTYVRIPHSGIVQIDDDVEIGSCNTIDRAKFGKTRICRGVKTDNLVHIAHNVVVGEDTVIVAQVGISGSVTIGRHAILAGQAGVSQHLEIGDDAIVGPRAGIAHSIPAGQVVSGAPGMPHRRWLKVVSIIPKLPELKKAVAAVEKRLKKIERNLNP